jgi:murein endopeptidase
MAGIRNIVLALAVALIAPAPATAEAETLANRLFGAKPTAAPLAPAAIGSYAKGCAAGLVQLPESGPSWQAMRLSRNRNWGHPETMNYLIWLSGEAQRIGWRGLYLGDISQPRGGPMTSGHASHQIGLDADVWMLPPARLNLSRAERENISSIAVRTADQRSINANWTAQDLRRCRGQDRDVPHRDPVRPGVAAADQARSRPRVPLSRSPEMPRRIARMRHANAHCGRAFQRRRRVRRYPDVVGDGFPRPSAA